MNQELETLNKSLPELKLMGGGERPTVRFYEGDEALYAVFNDQEQVAPKQLDEVTNLDDIHEFLDIEVLKDARKSFNPTRTKIRILHRGAIVVRTPGVEFCELMPALGEFHGDILIYANSVAFLTFVGKTVAVIIENQALADTTRVLFEAAWRICSSHK